MTQDQSRLALQALQRWVESGKPRAEVCQALEISPSALSRYLSGERSSLQGDTLARFVRTIPRLYWPVERRVVGQSPRVFLSSTFLDNAERRQLLLDAISSAGCVPILMEHWTSSELPVVEHCLEKLRDADILVGIIAWRYGYVPAGHEHSITEIEFRHAEGLGIDRLMFLYQENPENLETEFDSLPDRWLLQHRLETFRGLIRGSKLTWKPFKEATLQKLVYQALIEWKQRNGVPESAETTSAPSAGPSRPAVNLVVYYERVLRHLSRLQTGGFKSSLDLRIEFEDLYVPLGLAIDPAPGPSEADNEMGKTRWLTRATRSKSGSGDLPVGWDEDPLQTRKTTLNQALAGLYEAGRSTRALAILGHPGCGKTTLGKGIVVLRAQKGPRELGLDPDVVPVFIELRACGRSIERLRKQPAEGAIEALIRDRLGAEPFEFEKHELSTLLKQRLLVILDGLDEVPASDRDRIRDWVQAFTQGGSPHRVIVTSRLLGYSAQAALPRDTTEVLEILPLSRDRRDRIVRRWFEAAAKAEVLPETPDSEPGKRALEASQGWANQLLEALDADFGTNLQTFAGNPLLLTVLCLVYRRRKGSLPTSRVELYEEYVDGLLALWRENQQIAMRLRYDWTKARRVLEPMALYLHQKEGCTRASIADKGFFECTEQALERAGSAGEFDAQSFLEAIRDESGLVTGHSGDDYGFLHLRFQEYLAACELRVQLLCTKGSDKQFKEQIQKQLVTRLGNSWWREVLHGLFGNPHSEPLFGPFMALALRTALTDEQLVHLRELARITPYFDGGPFIDFLQSPASNHAPHMREFSIGLLNKRAPRQLQALLQDSSVAHAEVGGPVQPTGSRSPAPTARVEPAQRLGIRFVPIPAGEFKMGSDERDPQRFDDEWLLHRVRLSAFWMATTPVTNAQYSRFLADNKRANPPSYWSDERFNQPDQPVVGVSWEEATAYCRWAESQMDDGSRIRLPSEAEWEYACRAGTTTRFFSGDEAQDLARVGWYEANPGGVLHAVAEKPANDWGLHDMHGNVWEWCQDWLAHAKSNHAKQVAAAHPAPCDEQQRSDPLRVMRGGSFAFGARYARSAFRFGSPPGRRGYDLGFRPVRITP